MARHVVRHQHVGITDLVQRASNRQHVEVAIVGIRLAKVVAMALDVAEVDVENLAALAEVAHDLADLTARVLQHFGHGADAEIQSVVGAFLDRDKSLQAIDRAQDIRDALKSRRRRAGIVRMAGLRESCTRCTRGSRGREST